MFKKSKKQQHGEELVREAYKLGFEVGYYKHYESVGWVKKERRKIEAEAEKLGILERVISAYKRGKVDGARKKSQSMVEEKEVVTVNKGPETVKALKAISPPVREPRFFHLPKFLRKNQK
ncbi:MAG: hypothetical protein GXO25_02400 [Euryarchaeota archaeon]|nr:hypothetical protein [Euryarchaeota archaeon]